MLKKLRVLLLALLLAAVAALPVYAAISGVFNFSRGSLILNGVIRGLGNTDRNEVITILTGTATVTAECVNPGGRVAPGRNPISVTLNIRSGPLQADSNGNAAVNLRLTDPDEISPPPVSPSPKEAGCPNGNWTVRGLLDGSARWQAARVDVLRNGTLELVETFACTDNGATLTCSPS